MLRKFILLILLNVHLHLKLEEGKSDKRKREAATISERQRGKDESCLHFKVD